MRPASSREERFEYKENESLSGGRFFGDFVVLPCYYTYFLMSPWIFRQYFGTKDWYPQAPGKQVFEI
jgi:hypothetical protein